MTQPVERKPAATPSFVVNALRELGVRPSKAMGQNFLIDANIAGLIVEAARIAPGDGILEIGPGLGALTELLAGKAGAVTAVEKDFKLARFLEQKFADTGNVKIITADAMDCDLGALTEHGGIKVVSNLPYSVGSAILMNLFGLDAPPRTILATVQLDVAMRLTAGTGTKNFGLLGLWAQADYEVELLKTIKPTCFFPAPGVKSAVVRMSIRREPACGPGEKRLFRQLSKLAFMRRRKQLKSLFPDRNAVGGLDGVSRDRFAAALAEAGIAPDARPESLGPELWAALAGALGSLIKN